MKVSHDPPAPFLVANGVLKSNQYKRLNYTAEVLYLSLLINAQERKMVAVGRTAIHRDIVSAVDFPGSSNNS